MWFKKSQISGINPKFKLPRNEEFKKSIYYQHPLILELHVLAAKNLTSCTRIKHRVIWRFSDRASWYRLVSSYQLNAHFLYSTTIYMLHYNPQRVSNSTMLILRRTDCIITASGIVTLRKRPYSMPVESGLQSALNRHTVTIPEAVILQFVLLKMRKVLLETCRGL